MKWHVTRKGGNRKNGPIPVTTGSRASCAASCPFLPFCYGSRGKLSIHWRAVTSGERGTSFRQFVADVADVARTSRWFRGFQCGDHPGDGVSLRRRPVLALARAMGLAEHAWSFTHYDCHGGREGADVADHNAAVVRAANRAGYSINASCETVRAADRAADRGVPVVLVVPKDHPATGTRTPAGRSIVVCAAQTGAAQNCTECGHGRPWCARSDRKFVVGLRAHAAHRMIEAACRAEEAREVATK